MESKVHKLTDEIRFKDTELYSKNEDISRLSSKIDDLTRTLKMKDNEILMKEKDNADIQHRLKIS